MYTTNSFSCSAAAEDKLKPRPSEIADPEVPNDSVMVESVIAPEIVTESMLQGESSLHEDTDVKRVDDSIAVGDNLKFSTDVSSPREMHLDSVSHDQIKLLSPSNTEVKSSAKVVLDSLSVKNKLGISKGSSVAPVLECEAQPHASDHSTAEVVSCDTNIAVEGCRGNTTTSMAENSSEGMLSLNYSCDVGVDVLLSLQVWWSCLGVVRIFLHGLLRLPLLVKVSLAVALHLQMQLLSCQRSHEHVPPLLPVKVLPLRLVNQNQQ